MLSVDDRSSVVGFGRSYVYKSLHRPLEGFSTPCERVNRMDTGQMTIEELHRAKAERARKKVAAKNSLSPEDRKLEEAMVLERQRLKNEYLKAFAPAPLSMGEMKARWEKEEVTYLTQLSLCRSLVSFGFGNLQADAYARGFFHLVQASGSTPEVFLVEYERMQIFKSVRAIIQSMQIGLGVADINHDGCISEDELTAVLRGQLGHAEAVETVADCFGEIDSNHNGLLSQAELSTWYQRKLVTARRITDAIKPKKPPKQRRHKPRSKTPGYHAPADTRAGQWKHGAAPHSSSFLPHTTTLTLSETDIKARLGFVNRQQAGRGHRQQREPVRPHTSADGAYGKGDRAPLSLPTLVLPSTPRRAPHLQHQQTEQQLGSRSWGGDFDQNGKMELQQLKTPADKEGTAPNAYPWPDVSNSGARHLPADDIPLGVSPEKRMQWVYVPPVDCRDLAPAKPAASPSDDAAQPPELEPGQLEVIPPLSEAALQQLWAEDSKSHDFGDHMSQEEQIAVLTSFDTNTIWYRALRRIHYFWGRGLFMELKDTRTFFKCCGAYDDFIAGELSTLFVHINVRERNQAIRRGDQIIPGTDRALTLREFLIMMIIVAVKKNENLNAYEAVKKLFLDIIMPYYETVPSPHTFRAQLTALNDEALDSGKYEEGGLPDVLDQNQYKLKKLFTAYASLNMRGTQRDHRSVDLVEIDQFCHHYRLYDARLVRLKNLRLPFILSRNENLHKNKQVLEYQGFVELLIRLSCIKYGTPELARSAGYDAHAWEKPSQKRASSMTARRGGTSAGWTGEAGEGKDSIAACFPKLMALFVVKPEPL